MKSCSLQSSNLRPFSYSSLCSVALPRSLKTKTRIGSTSGFAADATNLTPASSCTTAWFGSTTKSSAAAAAESFDLSWQADMADWPPAMSLSWWHT